MAEYLTQEALDLLIENRLNDSKEFYDAHKPQIEELVRQPMFRLIEEVVYTLRRIDPEIECSPKRQISRIRRDTRFTHDKSLYRASVWCFMGRSKREYPEYPAFFFEFRPEYAWWGCGTYFADQAFTASYQKMILDRDPIFMKAKESFEHQRRFELEAGGAYKRTKFPNEPEDIRVWLDRKSVYAAHTEGDVSAVFGEKLIPTLKRDLPKLRDYYRFLQAVYDRRVEPETVRPWSEGRRRPAEEW